MHFILPLPRPDLTARPVALSSQVNHTSLEAKNAVIVCVSRKRHGAYVAVDDGAYGAVDVYTVQQHRLLVKNTSGQIWLWLRKTNASWNWYLSFSWPGSAYLLLLIIFCTLGSIWGTHLQLYGCIFATQCSRNKVTRWERARRLKLALIVAAAGPDNDCLHYFT